MLLYTFTAPALCPLFCRPNSFAITGTLLSALRARCTRGRLGHAMAKTNPAKPKSKPKLDTKAKPETRTKARGKRQEGGLRNAWSQKDWLLLANAVEKRPRTAGGRIAHGSWSTIMKEVNAEADVKRESSTMAARWNEDGKVTRKNPSGRGRPAAAAVTMEKVMADAHEVGLDTSMCVTYYPGEEATDDNLLPLRAAQNARARKGKVGSVFEGVSAQPHRSNPERTTFQCTLPTGKHFTCRNEVLVAYARQLARTSKRVSASEDQRVQAAHALEKLQKWNRTEARSITWEARETMHKVYETYMLELRGGGGVGGGLKKRGRGRGGRGRGGRGRGGTRRRRRGACRGAAPSSSTGPCSRALL